MAKRLQSVVKADDAYAPHSERGALSCEDNPPWTKSMRIEIRERADLRTLEVVSRSSLPRETRVMRSKFPDKAESDKKGQVIRRKCQTCAGGCNQVASVNCWEKRNDVAEYHTDRALLALASAEHAKGVNRGVSDAIISATIDDECLYVEAPKARELWPSPCSEWNCFRTDNSEEGVPHPLRSLCGTEQTSRSLNTLLLERLCMMGFTPTGQGEMDSSKFDADGTVIRLDVYVYDMFTTFPDHGQPALKDKHSDELLRRMKVKVKMCYGPGQETQHLLGMEIKRRTDGSIMFKNETTITNLDREFATAHPEIFQGDGSESPLSEGRLRPPKVDDNPVDESEIGIWRLIGSMLQMACA